MAYLLLTETKAKGFFNKIIQHSFKKYPVHHSKKSGVILNLIKEMSFMTS